MNILEKYYNKVKEEKRLNTRHGNIEYITSMKYIHECLEKVGGKMDGENAYEENGAIKILDIGAGTGRYSIALSEEGYDVSALEFVQRNVDVIKSKRSRVKVRQGTAVDLSKYADNTFDVTLVFGPMYHLYTFEDKVKALSEAKRVTKEDGYILVAYCMNDYCVIIHGFRDNNAIESMADGRLTADFHCKATRPEDLYDVVRLEDIDALVEATGLIREKIIAADGPANYMRTIVNAMDEETYQLFIQYHLTTCERMDMMGASAHTVDILRQK